MYHNKSGDGLLNRFKTLCIFSVKEQKTNILPRNTRNFVLIIG
jgi:hypothetical protein